MREDLKKLLIVFIGGIVRKILGKKDLSNFELNEKLLWFVIGIYQFSKV